MEMIFNSRDISQELDNEIEAMQIAEGNFIIKPDVVLDRVKKFAQYGDQQMGDSLPWENVDRIFRLRPGELSLWAGLNHDGKSNILGQVITWRLPTKKCLIASLEMKPEQTLYRMIRQYSQCPPSSKACEEAIQRFNSNLWIYDQLDVVQHQRILALCHFAAKKLNINDIVIDSLMMCGIGYEDYVQEKKFVNALAAIAKKYNIHIHLVCHMRKGQDIYKRLTRWDIRGAGAIGDIADNIIIIQRNLRKEEAKKKLEAKQQNQKVQLNEMDEKYLEQCDVYLRFDKNRHGGKTGLAKMFFHEYSNQLTHVDCKPLLHPWRWKQVA